MAAKAQKIYNDFVAVQAPKEVSYPKQLFVIKKNQEIIYGF